MTEVKVCAVGDVDRNPVFVATVYLFSWPHFKAKNFMCWKGVLGRLVRIMLDPGKKTIC